MDSSLIGPPVPLNFNIDPKKRAELDSRRKQRNIDLASQIAFMEFGISRYMSERDICEAYGITEECLQKFKKEHRIEIERYKDEHKHGKFRLCRAINQALSLREAMVQADIEGNKEMATAIAETLKRADKVLPFRQMKEMAEIMNMVDVPQPSDSSAKPVVNININRAQEMFEEIKKQKVIEAENADNPNDIGEPSGSR